jgi:hypothetical protein
MGTNGYVLAFNWGQPGGGGGCLARFLPKRKVSGSREVITIYAPMIYTVPCVMLLMRAASITWAGGRGLDLGPGNCEFFGSCEMASSR